MTTRWTIGLAPGSTADGVDAALLEIEGVGLELRVRRLHTTHLPYPDDLRELLRRCATAPTVRQISLAHRLLGDACAAAARLAADGASFSLQNVQCLGCPGYRAWHEAEGRYPSSLALGMPAVVAERTGVTVVGEFAARDLLAGGLGQPLTALADRILFGDAAEARALAHLGGVVHVVYLPAGRGTRGVLGFDAGPGCALLDGLMRHLSGGRERFDPGGKYAVQGRCVEDLLKRWLAGPALARRPPKAISPLDFGEEFIRPAAEQAKEGGWSLHDLLCTATHLIARAAAGAVKKFLPAPPARVLLSGGGVRNGLLWRLLEQELAGIPLERTDRCGVPPGARTAAAMGVLAALTVDGVPTNLPSATGASGSRLLGSVTPGSSANWARCLAWMAAHTAHLRNADAAAA